MIKRSRYPTARSAKDIDETPGTGSALNLPVLPSVEGPTNEKLHKWARILLDTCNIWFQQIVDQFVTVGRWQRTHVTDGTNPHGKMNWMDEWVPGTYQKDDVVLDGSWTMIANVETTDPAAPAATGLPYWYFNGTLTPLVSGAKQVIFGNRYFAQGAGVLSAIRISVEAGHQYYIYSVRDPLGEDIITELYEFVATTTGVIEFNVSSLSIPAGLTYDIVAMTTEPDPAVVSFDGPWDYSTPPQDAIPLAGEIYQTNVSINELRVSSTDNTATSRYAELAGISSGDTITDGSLLWTVQSSTDNTTWFNFNVLPATQSDDGLKTFTFNTVTPIPITIGQDVDYWLSDPNVQGLLGIDVPYEDIVPNETAYGLDIRVQPVAFSEDWDIVAPGTGTTVSTTALTKTETQWIQASTTQVDRAYVDTLDQQWTEIYREPVPENTVADGYALVGAQRVDAVSAYRANLQTLAYRGLGPLVVDSEVDYELGATLLDARAVTDGNDIVYEVRGRNGQEWSWTLALFFDNRG